MKRNVEVSVTGIHSRPDEPTEKIETLSQGFYESLDDGRRLIEYIEEQDAGGDNKLKVHNQVFISSDEENAEVIRGGNTQNRLEFGAGNAHDTEYITPYGKISMKVITKNFDLSFGHEEGELKLMIEYQLEMDGQAISDSIIVIETKNIS